MKKLDLTDLIPESATFRLSGTGDVEHTLRPVDLSDRAWVTRTFGDYRAIERIFSEQDMEAISKLVFQLVVDKSPFAARDEEEWNEQGEKVGTRKVGGYLLVMRAVRGARDQIALMKAVLKTIGISEPVQEKLVAELSEAENAEKKSSASAPKPKPTGKKSSISSKRSTGTTTQTSAR